MLKEVSVYNVMQNLMTCGVLYVLFMGVDQISLELHELGLDQRHQVLFDMGGIVTFHAKNVLIVVLVMEELIQSDRASEGALFFVLLGTFDGKSELHVVNTQNLALPLGDITVTRHRGHFSDLKQVCIVFKSGVHHLFTEIVLCPRKTVFVDPMPGVSESFRRYQIDIPVVRVVDNHFKTTESEI